MWRLEKPLHRCAIYLRLPNVRINPYVMMSRCNHFSSVITALINFDQECCNDSVHDEGVSIVIPACKPLKLNVFTGSVRCSRDCNRDIVISSAGRR
jgi:hypothetical protein